MDGAVIAAAALLLSMAWIHAAKRWESAYRQYYRLLDRREEINLIPRGADPRGWGDGVTIKAWGKSWQSPLPASDYAAYGEERDSGPAPFCDVLERLNLTMESASWPCG